MKCTDWPDSLDGPGEMFVAQLAAVWGRGFFDSAAIWSGPAVKVGGWLTGVTLVLNVTGPKVSWPPLAAPPLFLRKTVTVAVPAANFAVWNDSVPVGLMVGWTANRLLLLFATRNWTVRFAW